MSKDQRLYLSDILVQINRIKEVGAGGEAEFRRSTMRQDAITRNFEVIGEIIKRLDSNLMAQYSSLDWANYAGFRDMLIDSSI